MGLHILIAEPCQIYRKGLRSIFSDEPYNASFTEAETTEDLQNQLTSNSVNFAVAHQSLVPDITILPRGRFVILASEPDINMLVAACNHGARGYFLSENPPADLLRKTLSLKPGHCLIDPAITLWLVKHIPSGEMPPINVDVLTPREQEILVLVNRGMANDVIARMLSIAESTAKRHVANISRKLKLTPRQIRALSRSDAEPMRKHRIDSYGY